MKPALGLIETIGLTSAVTALDAASKAADVELIGYEKVIGVGKAVSVTVHLAGDVAAVQAAVDAGVSAARQIGTVAAHHVIARPDEELDHLIEIFRKNLKKKSGAKVIENSNKKQGTDKKQETSKKQETGKKQETKKGNTTKAKS
ncbi:BMC domain-containing protein [Isachenkonia alkalipeptolytica]|uniref:BMC domain-containing protein n=1 Tax=Isachenkonia alkalipeptolytica TaxID=2565777 RepID=A0AA43XLA9_9CLOT|nr:BMC domain-containing protein [Isachenkonia alkalipeptolytica]NBG88802.1 BMC domain-containing protein [Isachenkonia alkalipeptolytica]